MVFCETKLKGAFIIELQKLEDERGFFARSWCQREFEEHGLNPRLVQCNLSFNKLKGTLRGMHLQLPPHAEAKLVRCVRGSLYDVIIDLRPVSGTFLRWIASELTDANYRLLYVPEGCAHGFLTLEDCTEVAYQMSEFYAPDFAAGVRWNDPAFGVTWPEPVRVISARDQSYPDFRPEATVQ
jgi:dTDP-4-dehydrorhamnose 3,5-epimerase